MEPALFSFAFFFTTVLLLSAESTKSSYTTRVGADHEGRAYELALGQRQSSSPVCESRQMMLSVFWKKTRLPLAARVMGMRPIVSGLRFSHRTLPVSALTAMIRFCCACVRFTAN
ncbi:hypothetical protein ES703_60666 [subsurface metagenome]